MNQAELEALYTRLEKPLYNVMYRQVWNRETSRDLVQETFVRLWRMRRKVVLDTVEPLAYRIALNLAKSKLRRRKILRWASLEPIAESISTTDDTARDLEHGEDRTRLRQAVMDLPDDLRRVVLLCEFTGMNYGQVGEALGIPEGTVGSRRNRALKKLKVHLERR